MFRKKCGPIINVIAFVILIVLIRLIGTVFSLFVDDENHENREMAQKPVLTVEGYKTYANDYDNYFNDNIPFRSRLISLNNKIDFFLFDKSTNVDVIKGKNGWLFHESTLDDYQKTNLCSEAELEQIKNDALTTDAYMKEHGIQFVIFMAPNKSTIYGEYMPSRYVSPDGPSRTDQIVDYLRANTDIPVIYAKESLMEAREAYPELTLFLKLDTHWNYMGGFVASRPLISTLGKEVKGLDEVTYTQVNKSDFIFNGYDLANMLALSDVLDEDINYEFEGYSDSVVSYIGDASLSRDDFNNSMRTFSNSTDTRKVFLARDSFGQAITPFLAAEFSEMFSVHKESATRALLEEEQPDIFIWQGVERGRTTFLNIEEWPEY